MANYFNKTISVIIFPSLLFIAAVSPFNCSVKKEGGVFKSYDFGSTWEQKIKISEKQDIGKKEVLSLAIDPVNPGILYLGSRGSGLYRSGDEAEIWELVVDKSNLLDKRADVYDIEIDPRNPNSIYLAVYQGDFGRVLRSRDGAASFEEVYVSSAQRTNVAALEIDKINSAIIYLGTSDGGLFKSVDFGSTWKLLKWFGDSIIEIRTDPTSSQIIYLAAATTGVFKSVDQGQNWQSLSVFSDSEQDRLKDPFKSFQAGKKIIALTVDQGNSKTLHIGSEDGFFFSSDEGQTWQRLNILTPPGSLPILAIAQDYQNPGTLYYGAGSSVYRTSNFGQSWKVYQLPTTKKVSLIKIDPLDSNIVYAGVHE